jgi:hypothetical protein
MRFPPLPSILLLDLYVDLTALNGREVAVYLLDVYRPRIEDGLVLGAYNACLHDV